jgi:hypothetical protein
MKAFRFNQWQQPGRLEDIPVPEPGPVAEKWSYQIFDFFNSIDPEATFASKVCK